jgi:hypothetical protein
MGRADPNPERPCRQRSEDYRSRDDAEAAGPLEDVVVRGVLEARAIDDLAEEPAHHAGISDWRREIRQSAPLSPAA